LVVIDTTFDRVGIAVRVDNVLGAVAPRAVLDNVNISRATIGLDVLKSAVATISRSVISDVANQAIVSENTSVINVTDTVLSRNGTGISAFNKGATVRLSNNSIFNNTTGVSIAAGGTGDTFANNAIFGNTTDFVGSLSFVQLE
jgi:nitrous oxidase accessory protein NosD